MALQGGDDSLRALARGDAAVAFGERRRRPAGRRGHHDAVQSQLGRVADRRLHVALLDHALAVGIEDELVDLRPRQRAVGAEPRQQQALGFRRDLHLARREHLTHDHFEVARLVGKARNGRGRG